MATDYEIRYISSLNAWMFWDDINNMVADPQPTGALEGENLILFNSDVPDGEFFYGGAGGDIYDFAADYTNSVIVSDPMADVAGGIYNMVKFRKDFDAVSVELVDTGFGGNELVVTGSTGNTLTFRNLSKKTFSYDGGEELTAAEFAAYYPNGFAGENAVFDPVIADHTIYETDHSRPDTIDIGSAVTATDADSDAVSYSLDAASLALGFSIDAATGELSYTGGAATAPVVGDNITVTVIAMSLGVSNLVREVTQDITVIVTADPRRDAVFDAVQGDYEILEGTNGRLVPTTIGAPITASDENGDAIVYSLDAPSLALGFVIDANTAQISYQGPGQNLQFGADVTVTVIAQSVGNDGTPTQVTQSLTVTILDNTVLGSAASDTIDRSSDVVDLEIDAGDGKDNVKGGQGDDELVGGLGDDIIDLTAGGHDKVVMTLSYAGRAVDGGDTVLGFSRGADFLVFRVDAGDVFGGSGPAPATTGEFLTQMAGDDATPLNADDAMIVTPLITKVNGVYVAEGVAFFMRDSGLFENSAKLSSGVVEVYFESTLTPAEFFAAIGGAENFDGETMAIMDLNLGLKGLMGDDGIRFDLPDIGVLTIDEATVAAALTNDEDLWNWDVSAVTSGFSAFFQQTEFNQDIGDWDVGNFTSFERMFNGASAFNRDIGDWNVSAGQNFFLMFGAASSFNQDIGGWNMSAAINLSGMFNSADAFDANIGGWSVGGVSDFSYMFYYALAFNQDISAWDMASATTIEAMFNGAGQFNQNLSTWDVSTISNMDSAFRSSGMNSDLAAWDISSLTSAVNMLFDSPISTQNVDITLRGWAKLDTSAGETAINTGVNLGAFANSYSDATTVRYLESTYNWLFNYNFFIIDSSLVYQGTTSDDTYVADGSVSIFHALDGADNVTGSSADESFYGGAGDDTLTGGGGSDRFFILHGNAGNDTITDFDVANDKLNIAHLLIGFESGVSDISQFIVASDVGGNAVLAVSAVAGQASTVSVTLNNIDGSAGSTFVDNLVASGALEVV